MAAVHNLFTIVDFPKSDWRRLQRTDFVRSGVETISTPRRTKFVRRDQWFYVISHLHNNRSYGRFERTIKALRPVSTQRALEATKAIYCFRNKRRLWALKCSPFNFHWGERFPLPSHNNITFFPENKVCLHLRRIWLVRPKYRARELTSVQLPSEHILIVGDLINYAISNM